MTAGPLPEPLERATTPRPDRTVFEIGVEILGQLAGRSVAPPRGPLEALLQDRTEIGRQPDERCGAPIDRAMDRPSERLDERPPLMRGPACKEEIKRGTEAVDVGRRPDRPEGWVEPGLLGRQIPRGADHRPLARQAGAPLLVAGQAEVGELRHREIPRVHRRAEEHVGRFDVAVDHAKGMDFGHGTRDITDQPGGLPGAQSPRADKPLERSPGDPFHDEKGHWLAPELRPRADATGKHTNDIGVIEPSEDLGLAMGPGLRRGGNPSQTPEHFDRDVFPGRVLSRPVDDPHAPPADALEDRQAGDDRLLRRLVGRRRVAETIEKRLGGMRFRGRAIALACPPVDRRDRRARCFGGARIRRRDWSHQRPPCASPSPGSSASPCGGPHRRR